MRVEERVVEQAALGDIDVYKVSHHGSNTSTSGDFVRLTRPEVAIISNGSNDGYRHPRGSVIDSLELMPGIEIYQTNRLNCTTTSTGGNVANANIADPEMDDTDGHISIVVSRGSYVVSLPARGTSQTFPIN